MGSSRACRRPGAAPRELPAGVSAPLGQPDLLHAAPAGPPARRSAEDAPWRAARARRGPRSAQAHADRADRGQPVLPGGERAGARRDRGPLRRARRLPAGDGRCRPSRSRPRCRPCWPPASTDLPPEDKALLQTASVVGKDVPFALLQAIAELADDELRAAIAAAAGRGVPVRGQALPGSRYTFKHALTHEVAYGSLLQERRRALHARSWRPSRPSIRTAWPSMSSASRIMRSRAELWDKAVEYLPSGHACRPQRSAHRDAVDCSNRPWLRSGTCRRRGTPRAGLDVRFDLRPPLRARPNHEAHALHMEAAEQLAAWGIGDRLGSGERLHSLPDPCA